MQAAHTAATSTRPRSARPGDEPVIVGGADGVGPREGRANPCGIRLRPAEKGLRFQPRIPPNLHAIKDWRLPHGGRAQGLRFPVPGNRRGVPGMAVAGGRYSGSSAGPGNPCSLNRNSCSVCAPTCVAGISARGRRRRTALGSSGSSVFTASFILPSWASKRWWSFLPNSRWSDRSPHPPRLKR